MRPDTRAITAYLDPAHEPLAEALAVFVDRELAALAAPRTDALARAQARPLVRAMGAAGLLARAIPREHGGTGVDYRACGLTREALAGVSPLADELFALQCLGSTPIVRAGTPAQRARWLPGVASGELIAGFAMTEPGAGSDVAATATAAVRDGANYRLDGEKTFISNAGLADYYVAFVRTGPAPGARGLSALIVPADAPGLSWAPQELADPHPLGTLRFDGCRVSAEHRLGAEGDGFKVGLATLDALRGTVGASACGMAHVALADAIAHLRATQRFGAPLVEQPILRHRLAAMALDLEAARQLVYRALWAADKPEGRVTYEAALAKCFATEAAQRVVDAAVQLHGGAGVLVGTQVEHPYRAVRALRIYEGSTEVQHLVIARHLLERA